MDEKYLPHIDQKKIQDSADIVLSTEWDIAIKDLKFTKQFNQIYHKTWQRTALDSPALEKFKELEFVDSWSHLWVTLVCHSPFTAGLAW